MQAGTRSERNGETDDMTATSTQLGALHQRHRRLVGEFDESGEEGHVTRQPGATPMFVH